MPNPQEATSFKQLFQGMVPEGTTVVSGRVVGTGPLKIQIENDSKLVVSGSVVLVPRLLTDWSAAVDISLGKGSISSQTDGGQNLRSFSISGATMTVHNALKVGDEVYLLSFNGGKNYLIIDRKGS